MAVLPSTKKPARKPTELDRPWHPGDPIPAPDVVHSDGESAWALFNELSQQHEKRFAATAPMTLPPPRMTPEEASWATTLPASGLSLPTLKPATVKRDLPIFTLEAAMLVARRNNRVCPRPEHWTAFMDLLPPRKTLRGTQNPPAPATGAAWAVTPALTKRLCFREQIEWAEKAGVLESVMGFMQSLREEEWLHMGED